MRRLLYCLLGSALFHALLLWVPLTMNTGGAGEDDLLLVRVRLVAPPKSDAVKRSPRRDEGVVRDGRARQARTEPRHVAPKPSGVTRRPAARVSEGALVTPKPVAAAPDRTKPATEARTRTTPVAAARAPTRPAPEPQRASTVVRSPPGTVRPNREVGSVRNIARGTPADQVTTGADFSPVRYARTVKPRYPRKARRDGWEGTTLLRVLVDPDGAPGRVTVERTSGFDVLDEAAMKAVRRWRFHPARRGVAPLSSWVRIPVVFRLEEVRP